METQDSNPRYLHPYYGGDPERIVLLGAHCPACNMEHSFRIDADYWQREGLDVWKWDGNWERPTFTGSMLSNKRQWPGYPRCHSYLENGRWRFLKDSTHPLAGQEDVPMVPIKDFPWR